MLRTLSWLIARLPFAWLRGAGALLGWLAGSMLRIRRAHVDAMMRVADVGQPVRAARAMYAGLGAGALELLWLAGRGRGALASVASIDASSLAAIQRARALGRGIVLAASHTGNWELAACALASHMELCVVAKELRVGAFEAFAARVRERFGVGIVRPQGALATARTALERGAAVALLIDQVPDRVCHAERVSFLGRSALADRAPAVLAAGTGAPLLVTVSRRRAHGSHELSVLEVLVPPARDRRAWVSWATRRATRALEHFVEAYPESWLWLHRRWREPPRGPATCASREPSVNHAA